MRHLLTLSAVLAALLQAGCAGPPPEAYASSARGSGTESLPVGRNQRNEACVAQRAGGGSLGLPLAHAEEVFCGGWTQPSARIYTLREPGDLDQLATSGRWREWIEQRFQCEAPQNTTILGNAPARLLACTRRSNGSAHMGLVVRGRDGIVVADGLPATLPVIERMVTGQPAPAGDSARIARSEAVQLAVSRLAADQVGAADEAQYDRLLLLGRDLNQTENFAGAEDVYRQALAARIAVLRSDSNPNLATPLMHIAINLSNQRRFQEADRLFERAAAMAAASADRTASARLHQYRGMHELNRSRLREAAEQLDAAEAEYRAAVPARLLASRAQQPVFGEVIEPQVYSAILGMAETVRYGSVVASRLGDPDKASAMMARGQTVLRNAGLAPGILAGRTLRAEGMALVRADGEGVSAERFRSAGERLSASLPGERPVATTLFLSGREFLALGQKAEALAVFRRAAAILRERRIGLGPADILPFVDTLVAMVRDNPAQAEALAAEAFGAIQLSQRSETARFLNQTSARLGASGGNERVADAIRRRQDLDVEVNALLAERDSLISSGRDAGDLDGRIRARRAAREEAESDIAAAAPEYLQLRDTQIDAPTVLERLGANEALVQITLGPRFSYAIGLRRGRPLQAVRLEVTETQVAQLIRAARSSVDAGPQPGGGLLPFDEAAARELYDKLLRPLDALLDGAQSLVVVPDGPLLGLPFGMLLTGPVPDGNLGRAPWLIRQHAIVHAPSVQALMTLRGRSPGSDAPRGYIGFGDFRPASLLQLERSFPPGRCGTDARAAASLGSLPGFRREIQLSADAMGSGAVQRLAMDFTAESVRRTSLDEYRIVHFATHGLLPGDLSCLTEPSIMLSNPPNSANAAGAFLGASAITQLKMNADLVILSACNTAGPGVAGGSEQSAEALSGLARAFFIAGARGLVASHWLASDVAATVLMVRMLTITHAAPAAGQRPVGSAQALQQAQLEIIPIVSGGVNYGHPFYWASFALIGDGRRE
ncbi:CHAT domain-containing protein [Roseococcus sp.]|uniref:CHAT domain-containing protein n=1 Tax=Roseococcus sp. TaxID=2109646 RepID=UPI003BA97D97